MGENIRTPHWVKQNHQCRIPGRWISFDTESRTEKDDTEEVQYWRTGAAIRWRRGLKSGDRAERATFDSAMALWSWVSDYCRSGERTVCVAHNLGHDARIADIFTCLPELGWRLDWCNLDRNVSAMTWRSDRGTLVLCDLFTWLPMPLFKVGNLLDFPKGDMPTDNSSIDDWNKYCMRDADIVYRAVSQLVAYIEKEELGNWQPTGAGMAYSSWRHKFLTHKVLVHDNVAILDAERSAMHAGRAEAWRHGVCSDGPWFEVDIRSAYTRIAAEEELPAKYKFSCGRVRLDQYEQLTEHYRVLCRVRVTCNNPIVPFFTGERTIWPVGTFVTWIWDAEVNALIEAGESVDILAVHCYTKAPLLRDWATWILSTMEHDDSETPPAVRAWTKHCGRALIGRLSLRVPSWEAFGGNPMGKPGLSYDVDYETGNVTRMMHVGQTTFYESARVEGRDSLPQITGYIMAVCRARLWQAMVSCGFENIAHVDTDSVLVNSRGIRNLKNAFPGDFEAVWQVKATWQALLVYGPRNIRAGRDRKVAGVPKGAREVEPNVFKGEKWRALASDMLAGRAMAVTVTDGTWTLKTHDPRRLSAAGSEGRTVAIRLGEN